MSIIAPLEEMQKPLFNGHTTISLYFKQTAFIIQSLNASRNGQSIENSLHDENFESFFGFHLELQG